MAPTTIGSVLRARRVKAGLSVEQVSDILKSEGFKASKKTIYSWESGNSQPTPDALMAMCEIYAIDDVLTTFGYTASASARQQRPTLESDEQQLISYYRQSCEADRYALLRFAAYAAQAATEPSPEELAEEARRAAESLVRRSHSQVENQEVAK